MCTLHLGIFEEDCQVWRIHVCEGGWRGYFDGANEITLDCLIEGGIKQK